MLLKLVINTKEKSVSKHEEGMKRINEILGVNANELIKNFQGVSPDFAKYIVDFAYGDIYQRGVLSDKSIELAAVASLIGQGNTGLPLKSHIKGMLNVGWSKNEVIELIILMMVYVGFPTAVDAIKVAQDIFNES
jgi:4-carboxymuconolactone decarboxylase